MGWFGRTLWLVSQGVETHSKKPVLVEVGLRRKAVCSCLTRLTARQCQGFEKMRKYKIAAALIHRAVCGPARSGSLGRSSCG